MIYWAEGSKGKNTLQFANSELAMVQLFKTFVTECFEIEPERFTLTVNVYLNNGLRIQDVEGYWLNGLELPLPCLRKPVIDHFPTSSSGSRQHKLPYGVCSLSVLRSTPLIQHLLGAIQEYAGFDQQGWVG